MLPVLGNIFIIMILWGIINFTIHMFRIRKIIKENQDNPNIRGIKVVNGQVEVLEADKKKEIKINEKPNTLVTDPVCNKKLDKTEAYHLIKDGESHYFCSWDCREKFFKPTNEEHL